MEGRGGRSRRQKCDLEPKMSDRILGAFSSCRHDQCMAVLVPTIHAFHIV